MKMFKNNLAMSLIYLFIAGCGDSGALNLADPAVRESLQNVEHDEYSWLSCRDLYGNEYALDGSYVEGLNCNVNGYIDTDYLPISKEIVWLRIAADSIRVRPQLAEFTRLNSLILEANDIDFDDIETALPSVELLSIDSRLIMGAENLAFFSGVTELEFGAMGNTNLVSQPIDLSVLNNLESLTRLKLDKSVMGALPDFSLLTSLVAVEASFYSDTLDYDKFNYVSCDEFMASIGAASTLVSLSVDCPWQIDASFLGPLDHLRSLALYASEIIGFNAGVADKVLFDLTVEASNAIKLDYNVVASLESLHAIFHQHDFSSNEPVQNEYVVASNLDGIVGLKQLHLTNFFIDDTTRLTQLPDLEALYIDLDAPGLDDDEAYFHLRSSVDIYDAAFDIRIISALPSLRRFEASHYGVTNFDYLPQSVSDIVFDDPTYVYNTDTVDHYRYGRVLDISKISHLHSLSSLVTNFAAVENFNSMPNHQNIKFLSLRFSQLTDIALISEMSSLSALSIFGWVDLAVCEQLREFSRRDGVIDESALVLVPHECFLKDGDGSLD